MTTSSGYLRDGSKSTGLCRTPSMVAPSWLFHETTSSVLVVHPEVCELVSVSLRAVESDAIGATKTSPSDFGSDSRNATDDPSRDREKLDITTASRGVRRVMLFVSGSSRCR